LIVGRYSAVLNVALWKLADRGSPETQQRVGGVRRVALEIAMQRAARQRVLGPGEMVEANAHVARGNEPVGRPVRLGETLGDVGQRIVVDQALVRQPRG